METIIVDYGMGNLRSVYNACELLGTKVKISDKIEEIENANRLILPGVGAFADGMSNLKKKGLINILKKEVAEKGKPILGICLGMQLFATLGTEDKICDGLKLLPGRVDKLNVGSRVRLPHIGWNNVKIKTIGKLYKGIEDDHDFYFVHSYVLNTEDENVVNGVCEYGLDFTASVEFENIFGTQYHPEKSQNIGLKILKNFLRIKD